jgi:hypothetical protein
VINLSPFGSGKAYSPYSPSSVYAKLLSDKMDPLSASAYVERLMVVPYEVRIPMTSREIRKIEYYLTESQHFRTFREEVLGFANLWRAVEPYLMRPHFFLAQDLAQDLGTFAEDTAEILRDIWRLNNTLIAEDKLATKSAIRQYSSTAFINGLEPVQEARYERLNLFLKGRDIRLQRKRLQHARNWLRLILMVIK